MNEKLRVIKMSHFNATGNFRPLMLFSGIFSILVFSGFVDFSAVDHSNDNISVVQQNKIKGRIVDERGFPISNVSIRVLGSKSSILTDEQGYFEINTIEDNNIIQLSIVGYITKTLKVSDLKANNIVVLAVDDNLIETVEVRGTKANISVNMKNKSHMNLGQLLESNVPGVSLKRNSTTSSTRTLNYSSGTVLKFDEANYQNSLITSANSAAQLSQMGTLDDYVDSYQRTNAEYEALVGLTGTTTWSDVTTSVDNGVSIEFNGASSFAGQTSGMLFIIDGFQYDTFPIDYPMSNIKSVEIIRDPQECLKWGIRGLGGVVLITSNTPQVGKMLISYTNVSNYITKKDISASSLRLANSAQYLDYYLEAYKKGLTNASTLKPETPNLTPALILLNKLDKKTISQDVFDAKWDSLSNIDNRYQLENLNESYFLQNHNLNLLGGSRIYQYAFNMNYIKNKGNKDLLKRDEYKLSLDNKFNLKDNMKLNLLMKYSHIDDKTHLNLYQSQLEPYQLLLNEDGGYIYDFSKGINPEKSDLMFNMGYLNQGSNLIEDSYASVNKSKSNILEGRANLDWNISKNIRWNTVAQISRTSTDYNFIQSDNSSTLRALLNRHGAKVSYKDELGKDRDSVFFLVPIGNMKQSNDLLLSNWLLSNKVRYEKQIGKDHLIHSTGIFVISNESSQNDFFNTIYGYNAETGLGLPLHSNINNFYRNFFGTVINTNSGLLDPISRDQITQMKTGILSGDIGYRYKKLLKTDLELVSIGMSKDGFEPNYTTSDIFSLLGTIDIKELNSINSKWLNSLLFTTKISRFKIADLPNSNILARSSVLSDFDNSQNIMQVLQYNPAQLANQRVYNSSVSLQMEAFNKSLNINTSVNKPTNLPLEFNFYASYSKLFQGFINSFESSVNIAEINPFTSMALMLKGSLNSDSRGAILNNFSKLPAAIKSKEISSSINLLQDKLSFGIYLYERVNGVMSYINYIPVDLTQGNASNYIYGRIKNRGGNLNIKFDLFHDNPEKFNVGFNYILSYNKNEVLDLNSPTWRSGVTNYLSAMREGYDMSSIWSFEWAGLDANGDPQVYDIDGDKVSFTSGVSKTLSPDNVLINYSGATRAPWVNTFVPNISYKGVFASASFIRNAGHVMRKYIPKMDGSLTQSVEIVNRWKVPEDSDKTDVPAMAKFDRNRDMVTRYSSNSVLSANHIRLREIQLGYSFDSDFTNRLKIKGLLLSAQLRNVALWTKNEFGIDPDVVTNMGMILRPTLPMEASFTLNVQF